MSLPVITIGPDAVPQALDPTATAALLDSAANVAEIGDLITEVTDEVERGSLLRIWYRTYSEEAQGDGTDRLYLGARPIVSVTSVTAPSGSTVAEGVAYDQFRIHREGGYLILEPGWGSTVWTVVYAAGWWLPSMDEDPPVALPAGAVRLEEDRPSVKGAIFEIVKLTWEMRQNPSGIKRVKSKLTETEYLPGTNLLAPARVLSVLNQIRRPVV